MKLLFLIVSLLISNAALASVGEHLRLDLTQHWVGYAALVIFVLAYTLVIFEEQLHLRKSKPVLLAAGLIWILIALTYRGMGDSHSVEIAIRHNFLEYAELFFFLLVAMTYINAMLERGVFDALRDWLILKGFTFKALFWLTGILAFFISPVADNLTTALIMSAVVLAVGANPSGQASRSTRVLRVISEACASGESGSPHRLIIGIPSRLTPGIMVISSPELPE